MLSHQLRWLGGVSGSPDRHVALHPAKLRLGAQRHFNGYSDNSICFFFAYLLTSIVNTGIVMDMQDMFTAGSAAP